MKAEIKRLEEERLQERYEVIRLNKLFAKAILMGSKTNNDLKNWKSEALAARHLVYADGSASPVADLPFPFEAKAVYAKARAANEEGKKR